MFVFFALFFCRVSAQDVGVTEWLTSLYTSTGGPLWTNTTRWRPHTHGPSDFCEWHGVECDSSNRVVGVSLVGNGMQGTIPYAFSHNDIMQKIDFSHNQLSGTISPLLFVAFAALQFLKLSDNQLSGTVPASIGALPYLTELYLDRNQFSGELTSAIVRCPLRIIDLTKNHFLGKPPPGLFSMPILETLLLGENSFRAQLVDLLALSGGSVSVLQTLDVSYNYLEDDIPDSLNQFTSLVSLDLTGNILRGTIPLLTSLMRLTTLHLSRNEFQGTIPTEFWILPMLVSVKIDNNHFRGPPPSVKVIEQTNIKYLYLAQNDFEGVLPEYTTLIELTAALNPWDCPMPKSFPGWFDAPPTSVCTVRSTRAPRDSRRGASIPLSRSTIIFGNLIFFLLVSIPCVLWLVGLKPWSVCYPRRDGMMCRFYDRLAAMRIPVTDTVCHV